MVHLICPIALPALAPTVPSHVLYMYPNHKPHKRATSRREFLSNVSHACGSKLGNGGARPVHQESVPRIWYVDKDRDLDGLKLVA